MDSLAGEPGGVPSRELFLRLRRRGLTLAFAESLTAGNLTAEMVAWPGVSSVLLGGVTAYANGVKTRVLGVGEDTLERHGAVSLQTVTEMVRGLHRLMGADVQAAVSGIAGPDGGSPEKPVGLVHMAFLVSGHLVAEHRVFPGDRRQIIRGCVDHVITRLLELVPGETGV